MICQSHLNIIIILLFVNVMIEVHSAIFCVLNVFRKVTQTGGC